MKKHIFLLSILALLTMTSCGPTESTSSMSSSTTSESTSDVSTSIPDSTGDISTSTSDSTKGDTTSTAKEHIYSDEWTYDETSHWHVCEKEGHTDISNKADHTFGEWKVKTAATYTTDEIVERTCTVCGKKEEKTNPDSKLPKKSRELFVEEMEDDIYGGYAYEITRDMITCTNDIGGIVIEYRKETEEEYTTEAPIDAGTYYYRVTLNGTEEWEEKVVTGDYTIYPYNLGLPKTEFESLGTDSNGDIIIHNYDVSIVSSGRDTTVHAIVDKSYNTNTIGKQTINSNEIKLDNSNYWIDFEHEEETISLVVCDTSDLRVTINKVFTEDGSVGIKTNNITKGSIHVGDVLYVNDIGKSITVTKLSQNGKTIEVATVGEAVDMLITGATSGELKFGMYLTISDVLTKHQSAFADITGTISITTNTVYYIYFPELSDIAYSTRITLSNNAESISKGEINTGARLDFVGEYLNWIGREFVVREKGFSAIRAKGVITSLHDHSAELSTTGKCSDCGLNNVETLTIDKSGNLTSGNKTLFKGEAYKFNTTISLTSEAIKIKFAIDLASTSDSSSNYTMKVIASIGKITNDITDSLVNGVYTVPAASSVVSKMSFTIIVTKTAGNSFSTISLSIVKQ